MSWLRRIGRRIAWPILLAFALSWGAALLTAAMYRAPVQLQSATASMPQGMPGMAMAGAPAAHAAMAMGGDHAGDSLHVGDGAAHAGHAGPACALCLALMSPPTLDFGDYTPPRPSAPRPVHPAPVLHRTNAGTPQPPRAPPAFAAFA